MAGRSGSLPIGSWVLGVAAAAAVAASAVCVLDDGNGIAYTPGAWLVLGSSILLLVGALVIALDGGLPHAVKMLFAVLVLLDILGTAAAAYLLQAQVLLAILAVAALAWLAHVAFGPADAPSSARRVRS